MDFPGRSIISPSAFPVPAVPARASARALRDFCWAASVVLPFALFGVLLTRLLGPLSVFWPANGILLGMLLRHPQHASACGWLGAASAYFLADAIAGTRWPVNLWLNAANLAGILAGFLLAARCLSLGSLRLTQPRAMLNLLAVAACAATVTAIVGGHASATLFGKSFLAGAVEWFNGEFSNYVILLPILLTAPRLPAMRARLARLPHPRCWHWRDVLPATTLVLSLAGAIVVGGPGVLALPVSALIWCALRYPLFPTMVLTALLSIAQLFAVAFGLMTLPDGHLLYADSVMSARLGIALIALGPMAVAIVNGARNDLMRRLDHLARHDHLTGVLRRGAFLERASALLAGLLLSGRPAAVLMIDIDHFKQINDRFGHAQGDRVLAAVAAQLQSGLRGGAVLGRIGGEEFAVLLPDTGPVEARMAAERLRLRVAALSLPGEDTASGPLLPLAGMTASFGLAARTAAEPHDIERLMAQADAALYVAKAAGRNRVEMAQPVLA